MVPFVSMAAQSIKLAPRPPSVGQVNLNTVTKADDPTTEAYDGTTIHLRCCYGGLFAEDVALWSDRQTTGWTGTMNTQLEWTVGATDHPEDEINGPDYYGFNTGTYWTYTPDGAGHVWGKPDSYYWWY